MNGMDQERFEDLKDAYVLGALPEEERVEFLSAIFREARRLTNLVESVLRFSRADGGPAAARGSRPRRPEGRASWSRCRD